jgi:hypothetical protein
MERRLLKLDIYKVTFKQDYQSGSRDISYHVVLEDCDIYNEEGYKISYEIRAIEYALVKFFKEYCLSVGSKIEVISVEKILQ